MSRLLPLLTETDEKLHQTQREERLQGFDLFQELTFLKLGIRQKIGYSKV